MVVLCRMPAATVSMPTISSRSAETSSIVSAIAGALAASLTPSSSISTLKRADAAAVRLLAPRPLRRPRRL